MDFIEFSLWLWVRGNAWRQAAARQAKRCAGSELPACVWCGLARQLSYATRCCFRIQKIVEVEMEPSRRESVLPAHAFRCLALPLKCDTTRLTGRDDALQSRNPNLHRGF